jgi:hypothetical protein
VRFLILCDELEIIVILCVKPGSKELGLGEFLEALLVEDVLEMFQLGRSAYDRQRYDFGLLSKATYGQRKLEDGNV